MKTKKSKTWLKWSFFIAGVAVLSTSIFFLSPRSTVQYSYTDIISPVSSQFILPALPAQIAATQLIFPLATQTQQQQNPVAVKTAKSLPNMVSSTLASSEYQMRLKIPSINVDAAVEPVGITAQGALDVPKGRADVGWYDLGPLPGKNGDAVIDGHFGVWDNGTPAVFNNLNKLQKGDIISIVDGKGTTTNFIVRESINYDPKADATSVFNSNDGKAHLNLITCEGDWNANTKQYSQRLVVFADKE